jgi:LacI family transcriptional regulator
MTVSRALRSGTAVATETQQKIRQCAAAMGYLPDASARTLVARRPGRSSLGKENVALLVERHQHDWHLSWLLTGYLNGARARAEELGYNCELFWLYDPAWPTERLARALDARGVAGVVILPQSYQELGECFAPLWQQRAAVVVAGLLKKPALPFVWNDFFATAATATREVLALGYKRPGLALLGSIDALFDYRYSAGFLACREALPDKDQLPVCKLSQFTEEEFLTWFDRWRPDVVITHNHRVAVAEWVAKRGLQVPQDLGWAVLDLHPQDESLAGMNQQSEYSGQVAMDALIDSIRSGSKGLPNLQYGLMIESRWRDGRSLQHVTLDASCLSS